MLSFYIKGPNIKVFMGKLFKEDGFDALEVRSVSINHFVKLELDGTLIVKEREDRSFAAWKELKPYVFNFIKGGVKPGKIKIIFSAPRDMLSEVSPNAAAAFVNMEYENDEIRFLTATSQKEFSLDKTLDTLWDDYAVNFFRARGIAPEY